MGAYMGSIKVLSRDDKKAISLCIWCWIFHFLKDRDLIVQGKMIKSQWTDHHQE